MIGPHHAGLDQVFVKVGAKTEFRWKRMTPEVAAATGRHPILCNYCKSAASQLDAFWPTRNGMTACEKCAAQKKWEKCAEDPSDDYGVIP